MVSDGLLDNIPNVDKEKIFADIINTIKNNREKTALSNGLTHAAIENMRPAFNLCK